MYVIFLSLYVFKEMFFDLVFKCVDVVLWISSQMRDCSIFFALGRIDIFGLFYFCEKGFLTYT